jgi:hypothetical protein
MKSRIAIAATIALMLKHWAPVEIAKPQRSTGYSYPISTTRRTGKAAERRAAKRRRRARL